jgi:hypothetical protein
MKKTELEECARRTRDLVQLLNGYWILEIANGYWRIFWLNKDADPKQFGWYARGKTYKGQDVFYGPCRNLEDCIQWVNTRGHLGK